jgi:hypothetical protein
MRLDAPNQKRLVGGGKPNDFVRGRIQTGAYQKSEATLECLYTHSGAILFAAADLTLMRSNSES